MFYTRRIYFSTGDVWLCEIFLTKQLETEIRIPKRLDWNFVIIYVLKKCHEFSEGFKF